MIKNKNILAKIGMSAAIGVMGGTAVHAFMPPEAPPAVFVPPQQTPAYPESPMVTVVPPTTLEPPATLPEAQMAADKEATQPQP